MTFVTVNSNNATDIGITSTVNALKYWLEDLSWSPSHVT